MYCIHTHFNVISYFLWFFHISPYLFSVNFFKVMSYGVRIFKEVLSTPSLTYCFLSSLFANIPAYFLCTFLKILFHYTNLVKPFWSYIQLSGNFNYPKIFFSILRQMLKKGVQIISIAWTRLNVTKSNIGKLCSRNLAEFVCITN